MTRMDFQGPPASRGRPRARGAVVVLALAAWLLAAASAFAQSREDYRSAGQENWVRFEFQVKDAATGAALNSSRVYYQSDLAADWFHPDNVQPLLPPGTYRLVAWERTYWQSEETLVVDPRKGLRQQKTIALEPAAPKRNDSSLHVPQVLSNLVLVGNAVQKMPHMNQSRFGHTNIGNFHVHFGAWSEFPGGVGGSQNIASATVTYDFFHDAEGARKQFDFLRPRFTQVASKNQRVVGPVPVGLGDEALQISVDQARPDGKPGNAHEARRFLIRDRNVLLQITLGRNPDAPFIASAQDLLARVRALDMPRVKRLLEPEPFPWPKKVPVIASQPAVPAPVAAPTAGAPPVALPPLPDAPPTTAAVPETPAAPPAAAPDDPPGDLADAIPELTPAEIATVSGLAGGAALLGSLTLLGVSGVRRDEALAAVRDLLRGRLPEDPFDAWKRKYEALGWKYVEKGGVATFDPVDGARNEDGLVWSSAKGGFVGPEQPAATAAPAPQDGDVNERGEVWSSLSSGYVDRRTYEEDMAGRAALAEKDRRDLADMQRPDEDVAELHRRIADTRAKGEAMRTYFQARDQLLDALAEQRKREGLDAVLDETRSGFLDDLSERLLRVPDGSGAPDYRKGLENLVPLADVVGHQMRETYQPTYTYRDAMHDTVLQTGALALDVVVTKGLASSAVGGGLAMRDAARTGADTAGILAAGAKAVAVDYLFGKAVHVGAGLAGDAWRAARGTVAGAAETAVDALAGAARRTGVGADLVEQMKRNLDTLEKGVHRDGSGRLRASLSDVLDVQKSPHQVRGLKQHGALSTQEAFNNTLRNEVYKPHDQMLLERLRQSSPELADRKLMVHEFRTPGKTANPINTDRDFRVLMQNSEGKWVEVPKNQWERHSNDVFGELTFFDRSKCPKGMNLEQQKAWWAEQHGHTPTDRAFREASRDYSDQAVDLLSGKRTQIDRPRIAELKDIASGKAPVPGQPVKLADPQALAQQFHEKVSGNLRRGDPFEAIAQAQKGVDTLDTVRKAYDAQGIPSGELPGNLRQAMDLVKGADLPAHPDAATLGRLEADLGRLGYRGLDDFSAKLSSQFEALKWAR